MPVTNQEFEENKNQIHTFCHRATHTGGILLVAGIRGVGKTRLVDEALNERNQQGTSCRKEVIRAPRKVPRYLIKVDVDPFFPTDKKSSAINGDKEDTDNEKIQIDTESVDENALAFTLMKNIVFALTSAIDSRYSQRKYGRTLRQRLGFWRYWFAPNGITPYFWPKTSLLLIWFILSSIMIFFIVGEMKVAYFSGLDNASFLLEYSLNNLLFFCYLVGSATSAFFMIITIMYWRWKDWRALSNMSKYLFALVNAHKTSKSFEVDISTKQEWVSKLPSFLLFLIAIIIVYSIFTDNSKEVLEFLKTYQLVTVPSLLAIAYTAIKNTETKKHNHAEYDQTNAAWMISLLRRYLFLCHRCGLEPILVFDELDKLEELSGFWQECKGNREKLSDGRSIKLRVVENNKLDMFLIALSRLKSSLGAEFLWVLISGPRLSVHLQKHRHNRSDGSLGILATVISQEVVVGTTDQETAEIIGGNKLKQQQAIEKNKTGENKKNEKKWLDDHFEVLWLRSYGNLSTMLRMVERKSFFELDTSEKGKNIAKAVSGLWNPKEQSRHFQLGSETIYSEFLRHNWSQIWIHSGMLNIANRFIKEAISHNYFSEEILDNALKKVSQGGNDGDLVTKEYNKGKLDRDIIALLSYDPFLLQLVGERLLFRYFKYINLIEPLGAESFETHIRFLSLSKLASPKTTLTN